MRGLQTGPGFVHRVDRTTAGNRRRSRRPSNRSRQTRSSPIQPTLAGPEKKAREDTTRWMGRGRLGEWCQGGLLLNMGRLDVRSWRRVRHVRAFVAGSSGDWGPREHRALIDLMPTQRKIVRMNVSRNYDGRLPSFWFHGKAAPTSSRFGSHPHPLLAL